MADQNFKILQRAKELGVKIKPTQNNHIKMTLPNGNVVFAGVRSTSPRAPHNLRALLRRHGLEGL